ncbi:hypothetical protein M413DRAFT_11238 [Hebeloma cylindrosporum]|uniref:BTB domain-containing protein n=1 Tax=Hebeloma cylindrosporum TaxID=76867 RepID=A0A0C3CBJ1_HEBCY|nr:hypothetical protein M413DRAFT_11238 [Hebeloma cylindrosporum h7]
MAMTTLSESSLSEAGYVHDKDFYHESGDCVVLVGKTLFKVHRYRLASDGSTFGDMFTFPNGEGCPNSTTEDDPLVLPDSVDEFRALCWALYALPLEIGRQIQVNAFIPKFNCILNLFSISHKYQFGSLEIWAKGLLLQHCKPDTGSKHPALHSPRVPNTDLELMLRVATRHNLETLLEAAENALMCRVCGVAKGVSPPPVARSLALAEELGMRRFQGKLYYYLLIKQEHVSVQVQSSTAFSMKAPMLKKRQMTALLHGFWSLSRYWVVLPQTMRNNPLPALTSCTVHTKCQAEWDDLWKSENFQQAKKNWLPLNKLKKMRSSIIAKRDYAAVWGNQAKSALRGAPGDSGRSFSWSRIFKLNFSHPIHSSMYAPIRQADFQLIHLHAPYDSLRTACNSFYNVVDPSNGVPAPMLHDTCYECIDQVTREKKSDEYRQ